MKKITILIFSSLLFLISSNLFSQEIKLKKSGGVYEIPVELNGVLKINFIFDSGASDVSISPDVALTLIRTGTIEDDDWLEGQFYRFADGSQAKSMRFKLKSINVGGKIIKDVTCSISNNLEAPMLLGQSALRMFGRYTFDYSSDKLIIENYHDDFLFGNSVDEITMDSLLYFTPRSANKSIKGKNDFYKLWYNDKGWKRIPPASINEEADITLQMRDDDAYAMIIYEEMEIDVEALADIALDNAIEAAPDTKILNKEYRIVNGNKVIHMELKGSISGVKFVYNSYYYSDENGAIQFISFTSQKLYEKLQSDMDDVLNGLMIQE